MLRDLPVARLSAALEGTKPNSSAAAETFSRVRNETEPRPDKALEAVDFDTPASLATSASLLIGGPLSVWSRLCLAHIRFSCRVLTHEGTVRFQSRFPHRLSSKLGLATTLVVDARILVRKTEVLDCAQN